MSERELIEPFAELFAHGVDIGVCGVGPTLASPFEQAALARTSAVTNPAGIAPQHVVAISCAAGDNGFLLLDWLNAVIYEMAVGRRVFDRFTVLINGHYLQGHAWGEPIDPYATRRLSNRKGRH
jgi:SHS2 domain-containing protein